MRRVSIFRDDDQIGAMVGPDPVSGLAGFGPNIASAVRNLAEGYRQHGYEITHETVGVHAALKTIEVPVKGDPATALHQLANLLEGYGEPDFPEPDWNQITREEPVAPVATH